MLIKRWAREPLVHFLLGALVLFAFYAWKGEPANPASRDITITQEDRARMALQWQRTMQRPPTDAELDSLTETWLREEILYREALRLGLDREDAVVRKRLANKMDFLAGSMAEAAQPDDATLESWLKDNAARFAEDTTYSFDQLYFAEKRNATAALAALGPDWQVQGDVLSLPKSVNDAASGRVEGQFGVAFLEGLQGLDPSGEWAGPIVSGFGWHVVRLREREVGAVPPLAEIRERVLNDWRVRTKEEREEQAYQLLRDAYTVTVER